MLRERAEDTSAALEAAATRWSERFDARETQLRGAIDGHTAVFEALMDDSTQRIVGAISFQSATTQSQIEQASAASLARLDTEAAQITQRFVALAGEAAATVTAGAGGVHDALSAQVTSFDAIVGERGGRLVEALSEQTGRMRDYLEALDNLVGESGHSVADRIVQHSDELNAKISGHIEFDRSR